MTRPDRRYPLAALALVLCSMLLAGIAPAATAPTDVEKQLTQLLSRRFPGVKIDAVEPSPIPGLYQVISGDKVVYVDASGDHLIAGNMMDTQTKMNLSEEAVDDRYAVDFKTLPVGDAIKIVRGNGKRKLALFEDPDCPFCQQMERGMASMSDVTIYLFLFPIPQLHPNALKDAKLIWCSPDRASAWTNWMVYRTPIPAGGSCANDPIARINTLAQSLHITATPTIFLQNGHRIGGAIPLTQLQQMMAQASSAPLAAAKTSPN